MDDWKEALPEPLRDAPFIGKAETVDDAIGKLAHAAQYMGTAVKVPQQDAAPEDIQAFFDKIKDVSGVARLPSVDDPDGMTALMMKLGMPAESSEYALPEIEGFTWAEGVANDLRDYALQSGMTKAQFEKFSTLIAEQSLADNTQAERDLMDQRKALRDEWGETLENREAMIRGWLDKSQAPQEFLDQFENNALDVSTMQWLHQVAEQFKGDVSPISKDDNKSPDQVSPAEAREKIQEIFNNPAYFDAADPRQRDLMEKMLHYQKLVNSAA